MSEFSAATYNVGDGQDATKVQHLEHLADRFGVTIVGLQEASDRSRMLRRFRKRNPSWRRYGPRLLPGGQADPILWDNDEWECVARKSVLAVPRARVVPRGVHGRGAGPAVIKTKRVNKVVLRNRHSGRIVTVLNTHTLPSATRHNLPAPEKKARGEHFRDHIAVLVRVLGGVKSAAIVTGDFNADRRSQDGRSLLRPLDLAGLTGWTTQPTHDAATYDYVLSRGLELLGERVVPGGSDHRTVIHDYR